MEISSTQLIVYCERGAWGVRGIKGLLRSPKVQVIHFPYDENDRAWQEKRKITFAIPSLVTVDTTQIRMSDTIPLYMMEKSELFDEIAGILKQQNRSLDIRHFDSAHKSKADAFITCDTDFVDVANELEKLTGIKIFNAASTTDIAKFEALVRSR